jgi:hypothetical protein
MDQANNQDCSECAVQCAFHYHRWLNPRRLPFLNVDQTDVAVKRVLATEGARRADSAGMVHEIRTNDLPDPETAAILIGVGLSEDLAMGRRKTNDTLSQSRVRAFVNEHSDIVLTCHCCCVLNSWRV